ncbi:Fe-S cluster assembly scaffold SufA [Pantoea sp. Aalb]|uniref:Fe-S cluster assembly scaffold SufA n=1 Tax=Pantoea sp. Aalb TaxID=2576762 RepID=UPI0013219EDC|nr:Fe-S cluster assembly scaffold SufA [Pantoea sp. Aalb]MXP67429.1 Fe-S cluster assembly scaffold SufA [Pantoea sp. Aalb]
MSSVNNCIAFSDNLPWKGLTLTKAAAKHIVDLIDKNPQYKGLRLSIKKSGCAGFGYILNLIKNPSDKDLEFSQFGAKLFVPLQAMPFIDGTELDYVREGLNQILRFNNPKAYHTCGCGESFGIE